MALPPPVPDESAAEPLPRSVVAALSAGHGGMAVLISVLGILLVYFYLPPDTAGLPQLVTDATALGVINAIVVIAALGRLTDAVTDPLIAVFSDRSTHAKGRRIPLMRLGAIPAAVACVAMFVPPVGQVSSWNIVWLIGVQFVLYVTLTMYVTPAFSLVADLGRTPADRLDLATWTSAAWTGGLMVAALTPLGASLLDDAGLSTVRAWQVAVGLVCAVGMLAMLVPVRLIDEPRWARSEPSSVPVRESVRILADNPFFRFYLAADFAYFCGLTIVQTGLLYYVTVLLELEEAFTTQLLLLMVVGATLLYPVVNRTAKRTSPRKLVVIAFVISAADFLAIVFLGAGRPIPAPLQAYAVVIILAVPVAILSVLPQYILSDIAEHSALQTGQATAATFFAARTFLQKIGQTTGVLIFALLTAFGRDVGDDLGIRLSGLAGLVLYASAAVLFARYDEDRLRTELDALSSP
ncbi:MAG: MFS transporter [Acidimicrobiales bacterium]